MGRLLLIHLKPSVLQGEQACHHVLTGQLLQSADCSDDPVSNLLQFTLSLLILSNKTGHHTLSTEIKQFSWSVLFLIPMAHWLLFILLTTQMPPASRHSSLSGSYTPVDMDAGDQSIPDSGCCICCCWVSWSSCWPTPLACLDLNSFECQPCLKWIACSLQFDIVNKLLS